jgi:hypothetical protein
LIVLFGFAFFWLQRKAKIVFDEEIQTASDYLIKVSNPPKDTLDPGEWRMFIKPFANQNVTMVTIVLNNTKLINTLVQRLRGLRRLKNKLPHEDNMTDDDAVSNAVQETITHSFFKLPVFDTAKTLYRKTKALDESVQQDYGAVAIFVTFKTERAQQSCLHALSTGKINIWRNQVDTSKFQGREMKVKEAARSSTLDVSDIAGALKKESKRELSIQLVGSSDSFLENVLAFWGTKVLSVKEAGKPNDVRWRDLQVPGKTWAVQFLRTIVIMLIFVAWSGTLLLGLSVTILNTRLYILLLQILLCKTFENFSTALGLTRGRQIEM